MVIQLANGVTTGVEYEKDDKGYIIVETNYRIYAYTDSNLKISLLALFSDLMFRFPNMVVASITRESVREAFKMGITGQQIVNFLRSNAHPQISSRKPVLPETVSDQVHFWYNERNRLKFFEGVFYGQFNSDDDFLSLKNYARDIDALIWFNDSKRLMSEVCFNTNFLFIWLQIWHKRKQQSH
ncbi:general transcription factor IIH subunit 4 [Brachionus plicatilis]|uniref:General transcription factor IIH subunit 4 n=1 Tax=Brachionus plicatilis TaxID=10195 RepID=A0A3M7Q149_BRAPC|nr:general transcription factor IIH subunit 4 [Brachionus plicatilis]